MGFFFFLVMIQCTHKSLCAEPEQTKATLQVAVAGAFMVMSGPVLPLPNLLGSVQPLPTFHPGIWDMLGLSVPSHMAIGGRAGATWLP